MSDYVFPGRPDRSVFNTFRMIFIHADNQSDGPLLLGVGGDGNQRLGAATEQQARRPIPCLQGQRRQLVGKCKHDMGVRCSEQLGATRGQPAVARLALTLWAVPVAAGNGVISITCLMGSIF